LNLYLILLVSAVKIGREGWIEWGVLQRSMGGRLTRRMVQRLGDALSRRGLAKVRVVRSASGSGRRQKGGAPTVAFAVLDVARTGRSTPAALDPKRAVRHG